MFKQVDINTFEKVRIRSIQTVILFEKIQMFNIYTLSIQFNSHKNILKYFYNYKYYFTIKI
jgi:hypothetical protein